MLMFGLKRIPRFLIATSLLTHLSDTAHLQYSRSMFSLIISHHSPYFLVVALQISPPFFDYYCVGSRSIFNSRIPLNQICKILREGIVYPSMIFAVYSNHNPLLARITFRDDSTTRNYGQTLMSRKRKLSHAEEDHDLEALGNVGFATFVTIDSEEFSSLSKEFLSIDKVLVTLTKYQVRFITAFKEIILTKREEECIIGGVEIGEEIEFIISLRPEYFYTQLMFRTKRVWMYKSSRGRGVVYAPVDLNARFEIYCPYYLTME